MGNALNNRETASQIYKVGARLGQEDVHIRSIGRDEKKRVDGGR